MFVQTAAEVVRDVILTVGKRARPAETRHYRTGLAVYAGFNLFAVDGAFPLAERMPCLEHGDFKVFPAEFVSGVYSAGSRPDYHNVVFNSIRHTDTSLARHCKKRLSRRMNYTLFLRFSQAYYLRLEKEKNENAAKTTA